MKRLAFMLTVAGLFVLLPAQERPTPDAQRNPTPLREQRAPELPTIDLPEFVITGLASIDLPRVEKRMEMLGPAGDIAVSSAPALRERPVGAVPGAGLERKTIVAEGGFSGNLRLGVGSFRMPLMTASVIQPLGSAIVNMNGRYARSAGFAPWTSWSEGGLQGAVGLPVDLAPAGISGASLIGILGYDTRSAHWYGSVKPDAGREVTASFGGVGIKGGVGGTWRGEAFVEFRSTTVIDSSATLNEDQSRVRIVADGSVADVPLSLGLQMQAAGRKGSIGSSTNVTEIFAMSRWVPAEGIMLRGGFRMAFARGEAGQYVTRFLASLGLALTLDDRHRLVGHYEPVISPTTVSSSLENHRFLNARSVMRHGIWKNQGRFGLESDWTQDVRTRIEVEAATVDDLPMAADTAGVGVWSWMYGGASMTLLRGECVAKMRRNDYFSATFMMRVSKNAVSGLRIPYLPVFESRVSYVAGVTPDLTLSASLQIVHTRESSWAGPSATLPGYAVVDVHGSFSVLPTVTLWTDVTNLTNAVYEHWKRYQEPPFRMSVGVAVAW